MRYARPVAGLAAILTVLLLQATVVAPLALSVPASLPAVAVACVGLADGAAAGMSFGFAAGLLADLASVHPAGVLALAWAVLGLVCGRAPVRRSIRQDAVTAAGCAAVASTAALLVLAAVHASSGGAWLALRDAVPAAASDLVLAALLVPLSRAMLRTEVLRAPRPILTELGR